MIVRDEYIVRLSFKISEGIKPIFGMNRVTRVAHDFTDDVAVSGSSSTTRMVPLRFP